MYVCVLFYNLNQYFSTFISSAYLNLLVTPVYGMIGILELPAILMLGIQCVIRYPEAHKRVAAAQVENHSLNLKVLIDCFFSNILKWRGQASAFSKVVRLSSYLPYRVCRPCNGMTSSNIQTSLRVWQHNSWPCLLVKALHKRSS